MSATHEGEPVRPTGTGGPVPGPAPAAPTSHGGTGRRRRTATFALAVGAILTVAVLSATVLLLKELAGEEQTQSGPEAALALVFVAAAVVLILSVSTLAVVMQPLRLTDSAEAMGLPRGSVRAVIALLLIMLFFIAAIFLFNSTRRAPVEESDLRTLTGIDAQLLSALPPEQIRGVSASDGPDGVIVYDVTLLPADLNTATSDDLAKQLVTTLATLVTAVAAFYFGANSVTGAVSKTLEGAPVRPARSRRHAPDRPGATEDEEA